MNAIRIVIADDHPVFRFGLRGTLVLQPASRVEEWPPTSGGAAIAVLLTREEPLVIVERLLHVSPPASNVAED